ncbi:MAG: histidinol dehydrogenase [Pseudomonadota bacterium]
MKILNYPSPAAEKSINRIVSRSAGFRKSDETRVARILADVRQNGDKAVMSYVNRFDSPELSLDQLAVTPSDISAAKRVVDKSFIVSLKHAAQSIRDFHEKQVRNSWITTSTSGKILGQIVRPVDRAGIYVPGGKGGSTPLVSSVLMAGIPASIAGVPSICMVTPPAKDGSVNPHLLVAADFVGIKDVFKAGSAWGIAALAYGTETIPRTDVIAGPGNIYVTLAKKNGVRNSRRGYDRRA